LFCRDGIGRAIVRSGNVAGTRLIVARRADEHNFHSFPGNLLSTDIRYTVTRCRGPVTGRAAAGRFEP